MKWERKELESVMFPHGGEYLRGVDSVLVNDDNEEYCYNDGDWRTENSEIYVDKGKKTLLITVGESWTYGEGTKEINHRQHRWALRDRIEITYGGKLARLLDSDYWTFARPGNSNSGIFTGLFRILDNIPVGKYESIKVLVQMTECGRDRLELLPSTHPLQKIYAPWKSCHESEKISIVDWFRSYDEVFFDLLENEIDKHIRLPLDITVFKNFNDIWTSKRNYKFSIIEKSWLKFHAEWHGLSLESTYVMHPSFYESFLFKSKILKPIPDEFVSKDLDRWEKVEKFLSTHNDTNFACHPSNLSHVLWATYILRYKSWPTVIYD